MLNDEKPSILARDVLLLRAMERKATPRDIAALWGSLSLTPAQRLLLDELLAELAEGPLPTWLFVADESDELKDPGAGFMASLREVYQAWKTCSVPLADLCAQRESIVTADIHDKLIALTTPPGETATKDLIHYCRTGRLDDGADSVANVTLLEAPDLKYTLYWSTSIFRAVQLESPAQPESRRQSHRPSMVDRLHAALERQVASVATALQTGRVSVSLLPGDILDRLAFELPRFVSAGSSLVPRLQFDCFDYIDVSNVSDYVSLPAVLQVAFASLRPAPSARVFTQSFFWESFGTPDMYLDSGAFGMNRQSYEKLLNIRLHAKPTVFKSVLHMSWRWATDKELGEDPLSEKTRRDLVKTAATNYCSLHRPSNLGLTVGLGAAGAATLVHLVATALPSGSLYIVSDLLSECRAARMHKFELQTLYSLQTSPQSVLKVTFKAKILWAALRSYHWSVLQLVFTKKATAIVADTVLDVRDIAQLYDTFTFDCETFETSLLMTSELLSEAESMFVVVCAIEQQGHESSLRAVSHSQLLGSVVSSAPAANLEPWRQLTVVDKSLRPPGQNVSDDHAPDGAMLEALLAARGQVVPGLAQLPVDKLMSLASHSSDDRSLPVAIRYMTCAIEKFYIDEVKYTELHARMRAFLEHNDDWRALQREAVALFKQLQDARLHAANSIFARLNAVGSVGVLTEDSSPLKIDLHGLHVAEACVKLTELVLPILPALGCMLVVTGRGLHSSAPGVSPLRTAVMDFFACKPAVTCEPLTGNDGVLRVSHTAIINSD